MKQTEFENKLIQHAVVQQPVNDLANTRHYVRDIVECASMSLFVAAIEFRHLSCEAHQRTESAQQRVQQDRETALHGYLTLDIAQQTHAHGTSGKKMK